jgi:hypothetical protein
MTEAPELLPCPFCGSPADLERDSDHHGEWFNLGCSRHWGKVIDPSSANTCLAGRIFYTEAGRCEGEAIAAWNRRADLPAAPANPCVVAMGKAVRHIARVIMPELQDLAAAADAAAVESTSDDPFGLPPATDMPTPEQLAAAERAAMEALAAEKAKYEGVAE